MMRCIDNRNMDVYFNLAAEEYLLKHKEEDYFMVWRDTPAVVVGRHQRLRAEADTAFASTLGINLARRYSGGGAVYHDGGNINLTFIETSAPADFDTYLRRTLRFLRSLNLPVEGDTRLSIYTDKSLKVSGSAQSVHKNRVLYHCTLLYDTDLNVLQRVLAADTSPDDGKYAVPSVRSEVTNLRGLLAEPLSPKDFAKVAYGYFLKESAHNQPYTFAADELAAIDDLRNTKYASPKWIQQ